MNKTLVLYTGGTICMTWRKDSQQMGYDPDKSVPGALKELIGTIVHSTEIEHRVMGLTSTLFSTDLECIAHMISSSDADNVLILQSEDTLADTASYLRNRIPPDMIVGIAGSATPGSIAYAPDTNDEVYDTLDELYAHMESGHASCVGAIFTSKEKEEIKEYATTHEESAT